MVMPPTSIAPSTAPIVAAAETSPLSPTPLYTNHQYPPHPPDAEMRPAYCYCIDYPIRVFYGQISTTPPPGPASGTGATPGCDGVYADRHPGRGRHGTDGCGHACRHPAAVATEFL